jgi:hypothetical protein
MVLPLAGWASGPGLASWLAGQLVNSVDHNFVVDVGYYYGFAIGWLGLASRGNLAGLL